MRRHAPDLDEAIDALVQDHEFLDPMLDRLEAMAVDRHARSEAALRRELDGVAAVLANHLAYEERVLVELLDRLPVEPGSAEDQALRSPLEGIFDER